MSTLFLPLLAPFLLLEKGTAPIFSVSYWALPWETFSLFCQKAVPIFRSHWQILFGDNFLSRLSGEDILRLLFLLFAAYFYTTQVA